ncbi:lipopolysaccharide transport periplasmic protein LptA [Alkalimonas amylolytica]|uniref:Lipopolysaccharide export system protein LptA n=1 Tax=Alkalimonas amylolytica TaxID=152573 RepID=A0A1H3YCM0_ALKAM|nr:lipopolysaccharide transport periplasmic protein LptA [Alkalimonas amylolytica]SEA09317.1 lipopolysaccharide export system protein LptA [Alkalimonas amylolytica]
MNLKIASAALLLTASALASTLPDFQQPLSIDSEAFFTDLQSSNVVYERNVLVQQGSLTIRAERLEVDGSAGKGLEIFIASGSPATYSQRMEDNSLVEAEAYEIRYDRASRILVMVGAAELKQSGSLVQAARIEYNIETQQLQAERGENGRVRTIFAPEALPQPEKKQEKQQP